MMATVLTQVRLIDLYLSLLTPDVFGGSSVGDNFLRLSVKSDVSGWPWNHPLLMVPQKLQSLPCHQAPLIPIGYWVPNTALVCQAGCALPSWVSCGQVFCCLGPWPPQAHFCSRALQSRSDHQRFDPCLPQQKLLPSSADPPTSCGWFRGGSRASSQHEPS